MVLQCSVFSSCSLNFKNISRKGVPLYSALAVNAAYVIQGVKQELLACPVLELAFCGRSLLQRVESFCLRHAAFFLHASLLILGQGIAQLTSIPEK